MDMEWKKFCGMKYGKIVFHFIPQHALAQSTAQSSIQRMLLQVFREQLSNRVSLFSGFSTSRKLEIFKKIPWNPGKFHKYPKNPRSHKSSGFGKIPVKFFELVCFAFFWFFSISDLNFSILICCFDKLSLNFSIFSTN